MNSSKCFTATEIQALMREYERHQAERITEFIDELKLSLFDEKQELKK